MITIMFGIGMLFMIILLLIGLTQRSFPFLYLGFFVMLIMGLFLMNQGIEIESGVKESPIGSHNFITTYDTYTVQNDPVVSLLANTLFYLPFGCILLTTLFAIYWR